jgi:hypothetical protein
MIVIILCRIFCLPVYYPDVKKLRYTELALYGCETWSLKLREECRLRVFENIVLRRLFEPKRDEVTGEWRRVHNEDLYALYFLSNIIWVIKLRKLTLAGYVAFMGKKRHAYRE